MEHFLRFGKQRLWRAVCQAPKVEYAKNWLEVISLAQIQL
jgi:hypothetical protein